MEIEKEEAAVIFLHWNVSPEGQGFCLVCFLLKPQCLEQCQVPGGCSLNICRMEEGMNE